jgi:hypothetical protein
MKSIAAMAPVRRLKLRKQTKSKSLAAASIAQRYMELLRLRGQVHELEARQRFAEQNVRSAS